MFTSVPATSKPSASNSANFKIPTGSDLQKIVTVKLVKIRRASINFFGFPIVEELEIPEDQLRPDDVRVEVSDGGKEGVGVEWKGEEGGASAAPEVSFNEKVV